MATFLTTTKISAALEDLIKTAQNQIVLISPYVDVNPLLQGHIEDADRRGVKVMLVCKYDVKPKEWEWISRLINKEVGVIPSLHAKCYLNEDMAIITSMNLYQFSQQNNDEMGILVSWDKDQDLF